MISLGSDDKAILGPRWKCAAASWHTPRQLTPTAIVTLNVLATTLLPGRMSTLCQFVVADAADVDGRPMGQFDERGVIEHSTIANLGHNAGGVALGKGKWFPLTTCRTGARVEGSLEDHIVVAVETNARANRRRVSFNVTIGEGSQRAAVNDYKFN